MRSDLRLADLGTVRTPLKLVNVKVPETLAEAIDALTEELNCSKTAVIIALLNEGLDEFHTRRAELVLA